MESILYAIYRRFYYIPKNTKQVKRIEANHRLLIQRLSRRNRKLVLRSIDDKDQIINDVSTDSFIQGFRLAWRMANEVHNDSGHPLGNGSDPGARFI